MTNPNQSVMDAAVPTSIPTLIPPPAKATRARKPKRKTSDLTVAIVDSIEGSATATPAKRTKATKERKEKVAKEMKSKAAKIGVEGDGAVCGAGVLETQIKGIKATMEKATTNDNDKSAIKAAPMETEDSANLNDPAFIDGEGENFEDTIVVDAEDSAFENTPGQTVKAESKAKTTKAKVEKASAKAKATKVKTEKVEKPKTTKDSGTKAIAKDKREKKIEQVTGDAAVKLLKDYLTEQNRPYNGTDISTNLHGKIKKTLADKLLQEMAAQGQIMGKASGKAWVYWCIQDPKDAASPEELAVLNTTITQLRTNLPTLKAELKTLTAHLHTLRSTPFTTDLLHHISQQQDLIAAKKTKLSSFREGKVKKIEKEEFDRVQREFVYWGKKRALRKKAFEEIEAELLVGMSREDIWERFEKDLACARALRLMVTRAGIEGEDE